VAVRYYSVLLSPMNFGIRGVSTLDSFSKLCTDTALKALDLKIMGQAAIHLEEYQLASACGDTTGVILCVRKWYQSEVI